MSEKNYETIIEIAVPAIYTIWTIEGERKWLLKVSKLAKYLKNGNQPGSEIVVTSGNR